MSGITAEEIKSSLEQNLHGKIEAVTVTAPRRIFLTVQPLDLPQVARFLHDKLGVTHISTITGRDTGTNVEALYHYSKDGNVVTVRVPTARDNGSIPSIISLFAGAALYEREVSASISTGTAISVRWCCPTAGPRACTRCARTGRTTRKMEC